MHRSFLNSNEEHFTMSIAITSGSVRFISPTSAVSASAVGSATASAIGPDGDSSSVSGPASTLNKLKKLQETDPAKFKEAMSAISKKLTEEADAATDDKEKAMLKDMASKFQSAGESGDLSQLVPSPGGGPGGVGGPKGGGHGGPPPGSGGGAGVKATSSSSSSTTQAADTNGDGKVSESELEAYLQKQDVKGVESSPSASATTRAAHAYKKMQLDSGPPGMQQAMSDISSILEQYEG